MPITLNHEIASYVKMAILRKSNYYLFVKSKYGDYE